MDGELTEVAEFLVGHAPFRELPRPLLAALIRRSTLRYVRRGTRILSVGEPNEVMYVLRSGAVDITDGDGGLVERSDPGTSFGMSTLVERAPSRYDFTAIEDSLLLVVPEEAFRHTCARDPAFESFYTSAHAARLRRAVGTLHVADRGGAVLRTTLGDLVRRPPVAVSPATSVRAAAQLMVRERVSSVLVIDGERLAGIVTDRDLRSRVVAAGLDHEEPVVGVMTPQPVTAHADALAFEALMEMVDRTIHHLPVVDTAGRVTGLVSSTDLMRLEHNNPVYLVADLARARDLPALAELATRIPVILEQLVAEDATARDMGRVVTALGDALERRLLTMAEEELGPPPVPYCWVVLGSQARHEQGLASDQDNALVLSDEAGPEHDAYFAELAARVSAGLEACGYPPCPGEVMATNPRWRATLSTWREHFATWIDTPEPEAVLNGSIFFDLRPLHGDARLVEGLRADVLARTRRGGLFVAYLAQHAVERRPPIGFFRGLVLEKEGRHRDTLDLKSGGTAAVVELARVHALLNGRSEVNTHARLGAAVDAGSLSPGLGAELQDALEFVAYLRLRHQGRAVRAGREPDNFVDPGDLTDFELRHLRDAFRIVRSAQQALGQRLPLGSLS
ncbi:MAG: cyclic nucleotide-binding/CBS domain-containing protein [Actinomycetales bacterium]|nr:cyclic nucleotide-binding/CBS domain-containing protein [Actinomycetales bacterium]